MSTEAAEEAQQTGHATTVAPMGEGRLERACRFLSEVALAAAVFVVGLDILTRSLWNFSFEVADELGGYMLVAITFFSLCVCQANDGFHRVEFMQARLPRRWQIGSRVFFDLVALLFAVLLAWFFARYVYSSWVSGAVAPTYLMTPLWFAQLPLVLGMLAYIATLTKSILRGIADLRR